MIDFAASDWFDQYLSYRQKHPLHLETVAPPAREAAERFESLRHPFYLSLQQSGLLYGFPIHYPFVNEDHKQIQALPTTRRAKLILLDTMLHVRLLEHPPQTKENYAQAINENGKRIREYYRGLHEFGLQRAPELTESILLQRVSYRKSFFDFQRSGINSDLFWDLYFFRDYCRKAAAPGFAPADYFPQLVRRKRDMHQLTMQVLTIAARTDRKVVRQEKKLLRHFQRSGRWLAARRLPATPDLPVPAELDLPELDWIARRFLLDLGVLAIYADARTDRRETDFLHQLTEKLDLREADLLASEADLGCFLYKYGKQLHFYQAKSVGLHLLARAALDNFTRLARAAKMEYVETRDMAGTLARLLAHRLRLRERDDFPSKVEIKEAVDQLKDIPRFLPFFSMAFMPVPGITEVYILLAISLEKFSGGAVSLLPSQFRQAMHPDNEEE